MRGIQTNGREYRHQLTQKVLVYPFALLRCPRRATQKPNALLSQLRQNHLIEHLILLIHQSMYLRGHQPIGLLRGFAINADGGRLSANLLLDPRHTNLKKLIQVTRHDAQKAQALQQRHALILRLRQHPPVKREQAQFTVQIVFCGQWHFAHGGFGGGFNHGTH